MPNRYASFNADAPLLEQHSGITIRRIPLPVHHGGVIAQVKGFMYFANEVKKLTRSSHYSLVFATSSRLMTAVLGAWVARQKNATLYLDIRDIFVQTVSEIYSKKISLMVKPVLSLLEKWSFNRADHINLVSQGFDQYFKERYPTAKLSWFTNGIDREFLQMENLNDPIEKKIPGLLTVLYAGNIGEGQGLHRIIPPLAKRFEHSLKFRVIGDGGKLDGLANSVKKLNCSNVELLPPVCREALIKEYQSADIIFLHLNDHAVFRSVLPSKIFEYAATGKPIWAGVSGYAAEFIRAEIKNAVIFEPCNVLQAEEVFSALQLKHIIRTEFIEKYSRDSIMRSLARDILSVI